MGSAPGGADLKPVPALAWRPGRVTLAILMVATLVGGWLLSPAWWDRLGADSQVFYSAAQLASDGGNPYDFTVLRAQEERTLQLMPQSTARAFSPAPYAYPPLLTSLWEALLPLGFRGFFWANAAILLAAGLAGLRVVMNGVRFRDQPLAAWAFVVSAPFILGLVSGNPSLLMFLAWALAFGALARRQALVGGLVMALVLVKPPVGLAAAGALVLAAPALLPSALLGFCAGSALFLALNLLALGPGPMAAWLETLAGYGNTLDPAAGAQYGQCCLAGLPAVLSGILPPTAATAITALAVAAAAALALRMRRARELGPVDWALRAGVLLAGFMLVSPYLHLNDLVLLALPVLVLATRRLNLASRATLLVIGLGAVPPLAASLAIGVAMGGQPVSAVGFGIVINAMVFLAILIVLVQREPRPSPRASRAAWGPISGERTAPT